MSTRVLKGPGFLDAVNRSLILVPSFAKAMPTTTTYSGGKTNVVTQTGGPDVEEFLFQRIAGTDEAKSRKVFGFYDIFKQALGVD